MCLWIININAKLLQSYTHYANNELISATPHNAYNINAVIITLMRIMREQMLYMRIRTDHCDISIRNAFLMHV